MVSVKIPHELVVLNLITYDARLKDDIMDWLISSFDCNGWYFDEKFRVKSFEIDFNKEEDALMFKMRWM